MKTKILSLALILFLSPSLILAQNFHVIKDINKLSPSYPTNFDTAFGMLYFSADDGIHGRELWRSDGTDSGTYLIKDINPTTGHANPHDVVKSGNFVYFIADNGKLGAELWRSDGTENGTVLIKDINKGSGSTYLTNMTDVNGTLFFTGGGFWRTTGTESETVLLTVNHNGKNYISLQDFVSFHDSLFFFANNPSNNTQALFKMAVTDTTAIFVKEVFGPEYAYADKSDNQLLVIDDILFFQGHISGIYSLWKTDGSSEGTIAIKDIVAKRFINLDNTLFFSGYDEVYRNEIWKSNGSAEGTVLIKDISPNNVFSNILTTNILKGKVYFLYTGFANGKNTRQVWKTDGTEEGTIPAFDFTDAYEKIEGTSDYLFFRKFAFKSGTELWKSDGTQDGTTIVKDILPGVYSSFYSINLEVANNTLFYAAGNAATGDELWKTNGEENSTVIVKDINTNTTTGANPAVYATYNNKLFLSATTEKDNQPWITDGTDTGTYMLKEIVPDTTGRPMFYNTCEFQDQLYFQYYLYEGGNRNFIQQIWKTDGTQKGTELVTKTDNAHGAGQLMSADTIIFFIYSTAQYGSELWKTDAKRKHTQLVKDLSPGPADSQLKELYVYNDILYFTYGSQPYRSDGTDEGTYMIKYISGGALPRHYYGYKDRVYFSVTKSNKEIWSTDGTEAGTLPLIDPITGNHITNVEELKISNDILFFTGNNDNNGYNEELWKTSGDNFATLVKDISGGATLSNLAHLTDVNGILFFTKADSYYDYAENALWKTDGTAEGTILLRDSLYVSGQFSLEALVNVNGRLAFLATESRYYPAHYNIWQSDGTIQGTQQVKDINLNIVTIDQPYLYVLGDKLVFQTTGYQYGSELWGGVLPPLSSAIHSKQLNNSTGRITGITFTTLPNPFSTKLTLLFTTTTPEKVQINITDAYGHTLTSDMHSFITGRNTLQFNTSSWAAGIYFVNIINKEGRTKTRVIVKH